MASKAVAWARRWTADQFVITTSLARRPKQPRSAASHNLLKPCPAWLDGVAQGAEEQGLNHQVVSFTSPPIPGNARNAAEIHGFCAAVPVVRIHLPPGERSYGAGGEDGNFVAYINRWSAAMPQSNDLSRSW